MTKEMIHIVIDFALKTALRVDPDILQAVAPWMSKDRIRWCIEHYKSALSDDNNVQDLLQRAVTLLEAQK